MRIIKIGKNEEGKKLFSILTKYLDKANKSFFYKMFRKKNIVLNDKKISENEVLKLDDEIKLWLSEELIEKFSSKKEEKLDKVDKTLDINNIIYEDEDLLLYNKEYGTLSQKAKDTDISLNEMFISYLLKSGKIKKEELKTFRPSIINRLDRNTTGLIILGKTKTALKLLNELVRLRKLDKYYLCIVEGEIEKGKKERQKAYLYKDKKNNKVLIKDKIFKEATMIETSYKCLDSSNNKSLLKVKLITGKSHQIRAFFSYLGYPLIGDYKYGAKKTKNIDAQLLHSYELKFGEVKELKSISNKMFRAKLPKNIEEIIEKEKWQLGKQGDLEVHH